jgi:hypothetical protein
MSAILKFAVAHTSIDALYLDPELLWCIVALFNSPGERVQLHIVVDKSLTRRQRVEAILVHLEDALNG